MTMTSTLAFRREEAERRAKGARTAFTTLLVAASGLFGWVAGEEFGPKPQIRVIHHEVLIGTGCPNGSGPGMQVATDRFSDPALEGCKEIEAHDFDEEVK